MAKIGSICVYCGSSNRVDPAHLAAARDFGRALAEGGVRLIFGGGRVGLMGASSTRNNVLLFLNALETCLAIQGYAAAGPGARAAEQIYERESEAEAG